MSAVAGASAFSAPRPQPTKVFDPVTSEISSSTKKNSIGPFLASSAALFTPMIAKAIEEAEDYEYGAVDAPIGLAWAAGVVVIATAAVPVFMQGGEEAFEEMKERDAGNWGSGNSDRLNKRF